MAAPSPRSALRANRISRRPNSAPARSTRPAGSSAARSAGASGWVDTGERVASLDQVLDIIRDHDRRKVEAAIARALTDDPRLEVVFHIDADQRSRAIALRGSRSEVEGRRRLLCVMADVTDLRRQQNDARRSETRELIVRELGHRLRNLFPVILAMVKLTAQSQTSVGDYRTALERRLRALAAAERLLTRGASESASIEELVRIEVAPFDAGERHAHHHQGAMSHAPGRRGAEFRDDRP